MTFSPRKNPDRSSRGNRCSRFPSENCSLSKTTPLRFWMMNPMQRTVESVEQYGVLSPLIARPRPEGGYEIISGHRRQHAAQLAGLDTLPVIVRNMDDDAAVLLMVDSNLQRESILPSERAFAYKMKLEAMKHQAGRPTQDNYSQVGNNFGALSSEEMAEELGTSKNQIFRYIRLTNLIPELLDIQNLRKDREVTQEQLAIDLNISDRYMRNLEKGEKVPSVDLFVELRERFGSSLDYIVLGVSASQREQELQDQLQMLRKELKEMQRRILVMLEMLGESA